MEKIELSQLKNILRQKSIEELISIWVENKRHEYSEGTFKIIRDILTERGVKIPKQKTAEDSLSSVDFSKAENVGMPFFPTSKAKLIIMSLCTWGLYEIFWFYKNWKFLKEKHNFKISPFWRACFGIFFFYSLSKIIKEYANQHQVKADYKPGGLALAYFILVSASRAPQPLWLISTLSFLPLLSIQEVINNLNKKLNPDSKINSKFSIWNIIGIILGLIFWVLVIGGVFFTE